MRSGAGRRYEDKEGRYRNAIRRQHDFVQHWFVQNQAKQAALAERDTIAKKMVHERRKAGLSVDGQVIRSLKQVRDVIIPFVDRAYAPVRKFIRKGETHWCNGMHAVDDNQSCVYAGL